MHYIRNNPPTAPINIFDFVLTMRDCRVNMVQAAVSSLVAVGEGGEGERKMEFDDGLEEFCCSKNDNYNYYDYGK